VTNDLRFHKSSVKAQTKKLQGFTLAAVKVSSDFFVTNLVARSAVMVTTPRLAEDAATHWDATRAARSEAGTAAPAVAFSPWNAGKATPAEVAFAEEFWNDRVVKLAVTAEIDATAAIAKRLCE